MQYAPTPYCHYNLARSIQICEHLNTFYNMSFYLLLSFSQEMLLLIISKMILYSSIATAITLPVVLRRNTWSIWRLLQYINNQSWAHFNLLNLVWSLRISQGILIWWLAIFYSSQSSVRADRTCNLYFTCLGHTICLGASVIANCLA